MALLWSPKLMPVWTILCQQVFGLALQGLSWKNICRFQKDLTSFAEDAGAIWHVTWTVAQQRELLDHRFYLPEVANTGSSIASLGQEAASQMSEVSKRKWPKKTFKKNQKTCCHWKWTHWVLIANFQNCQEHPHTSHQTRSLMLSVSKPNKSPTSRKRTH